MTKDYAKNIESALKSCLPSTDCREKKLIDPGIDIDSLSFIGGVSTAVGFTANGAYIFKIT